MDNKEHLPAPKKYTIIAPTAGTDTLHEGIDFHNNNNKKKYSFGLIVAISGSILDPDKYETTEDPPIFYGVVEDPFDFEINDK